MAGEKRARVAEQISRLKEEKEKKENGEKYSVKKALDNKKETKALSTEYELAEKKIEKEMDVNPFVRRITLDMLIDISREKQGKEPLPPQKKTPFISREKEIKTPVLSKG